jgi:hypothetical protein
MSHEDLTREHHVDGSSDRSFGLVFAAVLAIIALFPTLYSEAIRWWAAGCAAIFGLVAFTKPSALGPLNRLWIKLGMFLGKVVSPVALAVLFYGVFMPIGALLRMTGKDPLRRSHDRSADTYWLRREPPGPAPDSIDKQF